LSKNFIELFDNNDLSNFLINSSKFIRSKFAILYLKSFNIDLTDEIYNILASGELIHSASLLHDDVIDDADIRRGEISFPKKYNNKISILAGDYILAFSIEKLLNLNNLEIIKLFKNCTQTMCKSEIKQYFLRGQIPTEKDYLEICNGKTAELFTLLIRGTQEVN
jgi:geranylgeranyl pyrophosphate synthase